MATLDSDDLAAIANLLLVDGVRLADAVAHGGTPGSSTATFAVSRFVGVSQTTDTPAFSMTGNGAGVGGLFQGGADDADGLVGLGGGEWGGGISGLGAGRSLGTGQGAGMLNFGATAGGNGFQSKAGGEGANAFSLIGAVGGSVMSILAAAADPAIRIFTRGHAIQVVTGIASGSLSDASNATPIVVTTDGTPHFLATGETVTVTGITGNTAANGTYAITVADSISFSLDGTTGNGDYAAGGTYSVAAGDALRLEAGSGGRDFHLAGSGALLGNIDGTVTVVTTLTNKTGFGLAATGLDAITATEPSGKPTTFPGWVMWLVQRFRRSTKSATSLVVKTEAGATVTTQAITSSGNNETLGPP